MDRCVQWGGDMAAAVGDGAWDDTELLDMFNDAVRSHGRKGKKRDRADEEEKYRSFHDDDIRNASSAQTDVSPLKKASLRPSSGAAAGSDAHDQIEMSYHSWSGGESHAQQTPVPASHPNEHVAFGNQVLQPNPVLQPDPELQTALADMLHAWYQSGYMTGRYQTLLDLRSRHRPEGPEECTAPSSADDIPSGQLN